MLSFDENRDFPFYNENPRMSKIGWLVLLISIPVSFFANVFVSSLTNDIVGSIFFLLIMLIPLLYFSNWNYSLFFKKPTKDELILAVLMFIAYFIYSLIMSNLLDASGLASTGSADAEIVPIVTLIFSMMAEELIKFIPLMLLLRVFFKYTSNRRLSIIVSSAVTLIIFGLMHLEPGISLISVLLIQGWGSLSHLYVYLKTKNLFASYISHLMTDAFILIMALYGLFAI
ncbi:MAG: CPBP family intramembrane metalloprotease [Methanobrevibacter thaueri]|uniref:CPBP family intramembrane metalloprotease n=1 Tax=Methanobrevibacter thaueri TaxID=190975 RepID=A0A8T3V709_9EURY|nr:CPBP family glutamic-type intramembrane protease [Methanobrevibacter thaueri]MBE6502383.1 CPBP family intramembrane metalloprotease [Methanobrevibacter thaueri]